jgi:carbon-monoxide dehydrogenase large subunit
VRFVGDMVAFVIAETLEPRARRRKLCVDYEVLPSVVGVLEAVRPARRNCSTTFRTISAATGSSATRPRCDGVQEGRACRAAQPRQQPLIGNPMEPRAAIAEYEPAPATITLWTTSQFPHVVRFLMARWC